LDFKGPLPAGVSIINPFMNNPEVFPVASSFYRKYYSDYLPRRIILGVNPGRFGAGITGIPFTDTERLKDKCDLSIPLKRTRELSSVFFYEMIDRYGGPEVFYKDYYISSVSPVGFTRTALSGKEVNFNYYDSSELTDAIHNFVIESIKKQLSFGIDRRVCFCLGTGKNYRFLSMLNNEYNFFKKIEPVEHPRYIMQYRLKSKEFYIERYLEKLQ
jgi:hypothetical protein